MNNQIIKAPVNIPMQKLHPFESHPYKVLDNEEMNLLTQSIQEQGILSPIIVRPLENMVDQYEIVSGHRRFRAATKAGLKTVPALIYAMNRDDAAVALVDSNLNREHILPSEKAFAYKLKMDALKHQGATLSQVATKSDTAAEIGNQSNESRDQVFRYIRLTKLIPALMQYVDDGKIAFNPAVELSGLTVVEQFNLLETIASEDCTPSLSQALRLKGLSLQGKLDMDAIFAVMAEPKPNQVEQIKFPVDYLKKYFPKDYTTKQIEGAILQMLEQQQKRERQKHDMGAR